MVFSNMQFNYFTSFLYSIYIVSLGIMFFFKLKEKLTLKKRILSVGFVSILVLFMNLNFKISIFYCMAEAIIIFSIIHIAVINKVFVSLTITSVYSLAVYLARYIIFLVYSIMLFDLNILRILDCKLFKLFMALICVMLIGSILYIKYLLRIAFSNKVITIKNYTIFTVILAIAVILSIKVFDSIKLSSIYIYKACIISINITIYLGVVYSCVYRKYKDKKLESKLKLLENQLDYQKYYYEKVIGNYDDSKKVLHDINNHMNVIKYFLENEDYKSMGEYINKLSDRIPNGKNSNICSDKIINAICLEKSRMCKEKNINISFDLVVNYELNIDAIDICTVFGNLIDNAIEACDNMRSVKKFIQVSARICLNQLHIKIINSKENKIKKRNGKFLSSKIDIKNHGIGLENVKQAVYKNQGDIEFRDFSNLFEVNLYMKCRE